MSSGCHFAAPSPSMRRQIQTTHEWCYLNHYGLLATAFHSARRWRPCFDFCRIPRRWSRCFPLRSLNTALPRNSEDALAVWLCSCDKTSKWADQEMPLWRASFDPSCFRSSCFWRNPWSHLWDPLPLMPSCPTALRRGSWYSLGCCSSPAMSLAIGHRWVDSLSASKNFWVAKIQMFGYHDDESCSWH